MDEAKVRQIIREELAYFIAANAFIFDKPIQILDGRTITVGRATGTMIATGTDQKLGFFGHTPVTRPAAGSTAASVIAALQSIGIVG